MDWNNPAQIAAFFDLHSDNPREGPGDFASTERAFASANEAYSQASQLKISNILDLACGPGMQTRHLAEIAPEARITAIDLTPGYIEVLNQWIADNTLQGWVSAMQGDMSKLDLPIASADLVWCEGAVYMLGVEHALKLWQPLLKSAGCVAFTEPVFLSKDLPAPVVSNWQEYPVMTDVAGVEARIEAANYSVVTSFVLGPNAWAEYYDPLQLRVNLMREKYAGNLEAMVVIEEGQSEIDVWRNFGEHFSYAFFVAQSLHNKTATL